MPSIFSSGLTLAAMMPSTRSSSLRRNTEVAGGIGQDVLGLIQQALALASTVARIFSAPAAIRFAPAFLLGEQDLDRPALLGLLALAHSRDLLLGLGGAGAGDLGLDPGRPTARAISW